MIASGTALVQVPQTKAYSPHSADKMAIVPSCPEWCERYIAVDDKDGASAGRDGWVPGKERAVGGDERREGRQWLAP